MSATPALVWWCAEDNRSGDENCHAGWHEACGPRLLVDPSALVVERDATGEWPEWAKRAVAAHTEWKAHATKFADHGYTIHRTVLDILDGLAAAQQDTKGADPGLPSAADVYGILRDGTGHVHR